LLDTVSRPVYTTGLPVYIMRLMTETETASRSRGLLWWGIAALVLLAGFADLARGGDTLAPILLAIGYCVLVPIAILK